jgi:two-component system CheB/CheR fusion protein
MTDSPEMSEEALRQSEERLRFALEAARFGMWEHDVRTDALLVSDRCKEIFGRPVNSELSHEEILAMVHPDDLSEVKSTIGMAIRDHRGYDLEYRILWPDGNVRWVMVRGRATYDSEGKPAHTLGLVLDLTERKAAETLLAEQAEQLRLLSESLQEATRRKDEFLAMLAHELRNPLAPVVNALEILERSPEAGRRDRAREIIARQVGNMRRLVDDLLDVSRITTGKIMLKPERLDMGTALKLAVEQCRPFIEECRHSLDVDSPESAVFVEADPVRVEQIISNLLNNAAKYTEPGGAIRVTLEVADGFARLRVDDNGIGIPPALMGQVFDLFTQGDRGLEQAHGGLGLGLTLVRSLVEMHGGEVSAASDGPGQGSRFEVWLPLLSAERALLETNDTSVEMPALNGSQPVRRLVLIADDNLDGAETLSELLQLWGYPVEVVHDGISALERIPTSAPALVLLDIGMPGMNGYDVARRLRSEGTAPDTVLVAITGYGRREDVDRARDAGFDHHLTKPVDLDELEALLRRLDTSHDTAAPASRNPSFDERPYEAT